MFAKHGELMIRVWRWVLMAWIGVLVTAWYCAPKLDTVTATEEFSFLPSTSPSLQAEKLFGEAFPKKLVPSRVVIVIRRPNPSDGLQQRDLDWIDDGIYDGDPDRDFELSERLVRIAEEEGGLADVSDQDSSAPAPSTVPKKGEGRRSSISAIRNYRDRTLGKLLRSEDGEATLVLVELTNDFLDVRNYDTIKRIEDLLFSDKINGKDNEFRRHIPPGLDISLSGEATVGRDMQVAAKNSAKATEQLTVILVIILLAMIYQAPLLALIPLITVFVAVRLTMSLLILMAQRQWITLFTGVESYVTVLLYGAGVDYCLFLIARYKEELDAGASFDEGVSNAVSKVGAAIAASAGTVICGIGMMMFAEFGKFRQAGFAISFGLVIVLLASLTFTPALLRLAGRWAFYPQMRTERVSSSGGWLPTVTLASRLSDVRWLQQFWESVGRLLLKRPMTVWLASLGLMLPFAIIGVLFYTHLSYGLLSDLPAMSPSIRGTNAVQQHFPAGATGPVTMLLHNENVDFTADEDDGDNSGIHLVQNLTSALNQRKNEMQLADVRSVSHPYGGDKTLQEILDEIRSPVVRKLTRDRIFDHYVCRPVDDAESAGRSAEWIRDHNRLVNHVTRLELTARLDPFSRDSIKHLTQTQNEIRALLPNGFRDKTQILVTGSTASIRDLKSVTDRDQIRIDILVVTSVFLILVLLLRHPQICGYLIFTVLFSYLVALGATYTAYWLIDPQNFAGLDWKVPMFLFTILIAVGEDYNIFLMTRIEEEQKVYGPVQGVIHALQKTGRIISSCGIIMAGTFCSLAAGSLRGMCQLGFALAFGVLLDTFVVRPILVPAYLVLLHTGRFGRLGRLLGAESGAPDQPPAAEPEG